MSRPRLRPRDRRALLVGLILVLPALGYTFVVKPYVTAVSQTRDQLAVQRALLQREIALLRGAPGLPAAVDQADRAVQSVRTRIFGGADGVTATAALAVYLGERARENRVLLQQSDGREAELQPDGVLRLAVSIRAVSDLEGILAFLHALETGPKLLRTERLTIERVQRWGGLASDAEAPLILDATLYAYALPASVPDQSEEPGR